MQAQTIISLREIKSADDFNEMARRKRWPMLCDVTCAFIYPKHRDLLAVWRDLARPDRIPYRREMTPRLLAPYMKSLSLFERIAGKDDSRRYRVRLMGGDVVAVTGELTGKFLDEAIPDEFLESWYALADLPLAHGKPLRVLIRTDTFDKGYLVAESLTLPLRADDGELRLFFAASRYDGTRSWSSVAAEEALRLGLPSEGIL
ncbi:MAG: hypothetical protein KGJ79_02220 [Alphaproteobacteria bacterium]|nr:hypothetical protein [Alphaproteobacteria bacterium]MDE2496082.1 hypothetical protein [Alphaproteobacteria bacterium]